MTDSGQQHRVPPQSLANLRPPWKPGESGNPGGRPRGSSILGPYLRDMAKNPDEDGYGEKAVAAARKLVEATANGDKETVQAILAAMDRTDGPIVKERVITDTTTKRVIVEREEPPKT